MLARRIWAALPAALARLAGAVDTRARRLATPARRLPTGQAVFCGPPSRWGGPRTPKANVRTAHEASARAFVVLVQGGDVSGRAPLGTETCCCRGRGAAASGRAAATPWLQGLIEEAWRQHQVDGQLLQRESCRRLHSSQRRRLRRRHQAHNSAPRRARARAAAAHTRSGGSGGGGGARTCTFVVVAAGAGWRLRPCRRWAADPTPAAAAIAAAAPAPARPPGLPRGGRTPPASAAARSSAPRLPAMRRERGTPPQ